jgi:2-oxoisovalerate dehydrogenase E1 component beta subunit
MADMTLVQAIHSAMAGEMERNPAVVLLGEDIGKSGGVFRATEGLWDRFGPERVMDTPLAESGIIGMAIGMALNGLRPVAEVQFADFLYPAFDQIVSELAKFRYRSAGQFTAPVVIRAPCGGGIKGLKVVMPSTPADGKGLLTSAMRDPDPVIFLEPKALYRTVKGKIPEGDFTVPLGSARSVREGTDLSLFTYGAMVPVATRAAAEADGEGISVEVIDLRTLWPLDGETVFRSVEKTGRAVVLHEAPRTCGYGAELAALIQEKAFLHLKAPIGRVTGFDTPFPYALEKIYLPDARRVLHAIRGAVNF